MAKYTREQRQRAVELYVKYECCAADVIRELGYPSREQPGWIGPCIAFGVTALWV